jgi:sucrose-6F-phosphate phosphohydrolase
MKFLLVTDLDNTLVGDEKATEKLNYCLEKRRNQFCIVYATGRSYSSANQLKVEAELLEPDYWIVGVGTEIYHQNQLDSSWVSCLSLGWNRDKIEAIALSFSTLQPQSQGEQNPWKISFHLEPTADFSVIKQLQTQLEQANLPAQVIFSSGRDVDILPESGNKGKATSFLRQRLDISADATLVCGDSGNDISLFQQPAKGVIVNNAQPELLKWYYERRSPHHYLARSPYAQGILEALEYFNFN